MNILNQDMWCIIGNKLRKLMRFCYRKSKSDICHMCGSPNQLTYSSETLCYDCRSKQRKDLPVVPFRITGAEIAWNETEKDITENNNELSPLCKVLDEAKYVFEDDKNIDIDNVCGYIRNCYIVENEVQE